MTERKPLGLSADQKQLREQRARALDRLANPTPEPEGGWPAPTQGIERPARFSPDGDRGAPNRDTRPPRPARSGGGYPQADRPDRAGPFDRAVRPDRFEHPDRPARSPRGDSFAPSERANTPFRPARGDDAGRSSPPAIRPFNPPGKPPAAVRIRAEDAAHESPDGTRLNKRMAELRMCSRREGDAWIERGWVTVNGVVAEMGMLVKPTDVIEVSEQAKGEQQQQVTILLHKPMGFVSGQAEDGHQPAVTLINPRTHWQSDTSRTRFNFSQLQGLAPAGRLDIDSVGLLVLTQDGRVARQLIGEDSEMEKEYLVRVVYDSPDGEVATDVQAAYPAERMALLRHGLSLDGEPLKPAQVEWQNPEQLRFVLTQGKKRQIRRMCEQVGLKVVGLKRIRMGRVVLGSLPAGQWRYLGATEQF